MKKKKLLVFLQERYYQKKLGGVLKRFNDYEITIISRSQLVGSKNVENNYIATSIFQIITLILKLRKTRFDVLLASNVDDFFFHLIYKFTSFQEFITFDEGQRSLMLDNYYFVKTFADSGQSKYKLLNFLFKFPLPYGKYFDESSTHYTFYDEKIFNHALKGHKNLIFLEELQESNKDRKKIEKIFVGVSSFWYTNFYQRTIEKGGNLYCEKLEEAAKRINSLKPDLYLMHPREENELVAMLDSNIIISKGPFGGNEYFINALNNSNKVKVYSERSGIVYDIDPVIDIIFVDIFDRFDANFFHDFIKKYDTFKKQQNPNHKGSEMISY